MNFHQDIRITLFTLAYMEYIALPACIRQFTQEVSKIVLKLMQMILRNHGTVINEKDFAGFYALGCLKDLTCFLVGTLDSG